MVQRNKVIGMSIVVIGIMSMAIGGLALVVERFPINVIFIVSEYPICESEIQSNNNNNNSSSFIELWTPIYVYPGVGFFVKMCNLNPDENYSLSISNDRNGETYRKELSLLSSNGNRTYITERFLLENIFLENVETNDLIEFILSIDNTEIAIAVSFVIQVWN